MAKRYLEDFDWLNEGLEGEDFVDDIFGESSPPYTFPTTDTPHPNTNTPGPSNDPPPNIDLDKK